MANQPTILALSANVPPEGLAAITRDLSRDLSHAGIQTSSPGQAPESGARGDAVTIGQIAVDLITSGAVTALIECLKAYLARERSLVFKVTRLDGTVIEVNAKNVSDSVTEQALSRSVPPL